MFDSPTGSVGRLASLVRRTSTGVRVAGVGLLVLLVGGAVVQTLWRTDSTLVASVHRGTLSVRLLETGTLRPAQSMTYYSPLIGIQSEVIFLAPEGTRVMAGDLLASLDTRELQVELERSVQAVRQAEVDLRVAEAERDQAQASLDSVSGDQGALDLYEARTNLELTERRTARMRQDYDNLLPLLENRFITRDELDRLGFELEQAEAQLEIERRRLELLNEQILPRNRRQAELQVIQRESRLQNVRVRLVEARGRETELRDAIASARIEARSAGLVVYEDNLSASPRRKIRMGDRVTSSQGLVTIPEVDRMLVESSVREADLHRVRFGQPVSVSVDAFPDVALTGRVSRIGTLARADNGRSATEKRFDITVELETSDVELRPEMTARLEILVEERRDVLLVPVTAVVERDGASTVWLKRGRRFVAHPVELGGTDDVEVEVVAGLQEGDQVSLAGEALLSGSPAGAAGSE